MGDYSSLSIYVIGLLAGLALLWNLIARLRRMLKESVELAVPVARQQQIEFRTPGEKGLHIEGPLFTTAFAGVSFTLRDEATGQAVPLRMVLFRSSVRGFSKMRMLLYRCFISHAGCFDLAIAGMKEGRDYSDCRIVFAKPYVAKTVLFILGLLLASGLTICSIVFGLLTLLGQI
ncbi:MAG: hypothetical protein WC600_17750 [Desulfobaccales bacterium]